MSKIQLADKTVLITGAAKGIGRAAAVAFAREGCRLVMADIDEEALLEATKIVNNQTPEDRPKAVSVRADVSDDDDLQGIVSSAIASFGSIDILINNAGLVQGGRFQDCEPSRLRKLVEVNMTAPLRLTQLVIPHMIKQGGGHIVNVFSSAALLSIPGFAGYGATKAGLFAFTRTMRRELLSYGITLTAICPGSTATDMTQGMIDFGRGTGRQPHHGPEVPAAAMVAAVKKNRRVVIISSQALAQRLLTFLDRVFPNLLDKMWLKMANEDHYECASRGGK